MHDAAHILGGGVGALLGMMGAGSYVDKTNNKAASSGGKPMNPWAARGVKWGSALASALIVGYVAGKIIK